MVGGVRQQKAGSQDCTSGVMGEGDKAWPEKGAELDHTALGRDGGRRLVSGFVFSVRRTGMF